MYICTGKLKSSSPNGQVISVFSVSPLPLSLSLSLSPPLSIIPLPPGHYIDIIRCGEDYVLPDGSLQLSSTLKVFDTSSCSGRPLDPVGNPLPPIPYDITAVTINWRAENTTVRG